MKYPNTRPSDYALSLPIAFVMTDAKHKKWEHIQEYKDISNAWADFETYKDTRPCMILNFGMIIADNETPQ